MCRVIQQYIRTAKQQMPLTAYATSWITNEDRLRALNFWLPWNLCTWKENIKESTEIPTLRAWFCSTAVRKPVTCMVMLWCHVKDASECMPSQSDIGLLLFNIMVIFHFTKFSQVVRACCMCMCMYAHTHTHTHTHTHAQTWILTHTLHTQKLKYKHTAHTCMRTCAHMHTHKHTLM